MSTYRVTIHCDAGTCAEALTIVEGGTDSEADRAHRRGVVEQRARARSWTVEGRHLCPRCAASR